MPLDEDAAEGNHPNSQFKQTAVSNVTARDIQIGQIVQNIVYWGIPSSSPLRPFALVISIALWLTLLVIGFVQLWQDGAGVVPLLMLIVGSGFLSLTCLYYAWFWKPEIQDKSPPISEGSLADDRVKKQQIKHRSRQRTRRLALVGLFAVPLLTLAGFGLWRSMPAPNVLLLVADFDGVEQQNYRVTENILRNLRNATRPYADVKVVALNRTITEQQGSKGARAAGERKKASIVIWGNYGVTADHVQVGTHFEVLKPPTNFPELGETASGEAQTAAIAELTSFKLQTRLSNEMSYLTLFTLGMVQYAKDDWDGASDRFSDALAQMKTTSSALSQGIILFYRGNSSALKDDYKSAIADYNQAIKLQPDLVDAYYNRGLAYQGQGNYTTAIANYNQAIKLQPDLAEAYYNRGNAYYKQGNYAAAIADYNQAIKLQPDLAEAYTNRGNAYRNQGNYTIAITDYNQAVKLQPDLAEAYSNRGNAYRNQGNYTAAIADYNQAIKLQPDLAEAYYNRGNAYRNQGNYTAAIADYNQAIKLQPDLAEAYYNRGIVHADRGNYTIAITDYNQAVKLKPDFAAAYSNRGNAYAEQSNYTAAIADYTQAIKLKPDAAEAYSNRGIAYAEQSNYAAAIADLTQAIKLKPDFVVVYYNRGVAYVEQGNYAAAIADYNQAIKLKPDDAKAYYNKACVYSLQKEVKAAIENLQQAIDLNPKAREAAKTDSNFDNIRKDKQFQALVGK